VNARVVVNPWQVWQCLSRCVAFGLVLIAAACGRNLQPRPTEPYRVQVLADGAVGYWPLDKLAASSVPDQSSFANHGTIAGDAAVLRTSEAANEGQAGMVFRGTGQVTIPDAASLQMKGGSLTLEIWVKPVSIQRGEVYLLGKGTAGVQTEYALVLMDGVPAYQSVIELYRSNASALKAGVWTHLAVAIAANAAGTFWVNGVQAGTFADGRGNVVTSSTQPVMIGNEAGLKANFLGTLMGPAIYAHALTTEQVARHVTLATDAQP
jgi:hypothetical protein